MYNLERMEHTCRRLATCSCMVHKGSSAYRIGAQACKMGCFIPHLLYPIYKEVNGEVNYRPQSQVVVHEGHICLSTLNCTNLVFKFLFQFNLIPRPRWLSILACHVILELLSLKSYQNTLYTSCLHPLSSSSIVQVTTNLLFCLNIWFGLQFTQCKVECGVRDNKVDGV